jgi:hypothetical protein
MFSWLLTVGVSAQTIVVPTLSVTETYDSNVFYAPKSQLQPGSKPEDFYTQVTPQINVAHAGPLVTGSLSAGALITRYLENHNLDYTGVNAAGQMNIKGWANKLSQRISSLAITGIYQFTPSSSAFGASAGGVGTGYGTTTITTPVNAGIITNRVSTHSYNLGISGGYTLTRTTTLTSSYNYTRLTFGSQSGGLNNQLFDTVGHQAMTALRTKLTATDTVGTSATMTHFQQEQSTASGSSSFTTITATGNWTRMWTQRLNTSLSGGGIATLPRNTGIPGETIKAGVAPTATATLSYTSFSESLRAVGSSAPDSFAGPSAPGPFYGLPTLAGTLTSGGIFPPGQFTAALSYNFSVFPSYAIGAGPTKTHVVGANVTGGITSKLTGQLGMNYAHGSTNAPLNRYDTVGLTAGARYLFGPVLANLTYNWLYFSTASAPTPGSINETAFSKKMVMLTFAYAFTSQSFFKMGGFGNWGTSTSSEGSAGPSGVDTGTRPSSEGSSLSK